MNKSRIEKKAKEVVFIEQADGQLVTKQGIDISLFADNITEIFDCITEGRSVPQKYYRRTTGRDHLLLEKGWMHLHVGYGINDDILLMVEQTEDLVVFIALTDHEIFDEKPRAKSILGLGSKVAQAKLTRKSTRLTGTPISKTLKKPGKSPGSTDV